MPAMKHASTLRHLGQFSVVLESASSQAAMMNLKPGEVSGAFGNEHPRAEQWLFVISGAGTVRHGRRKRALKRGDLVLIPRGEAHQIINTQKRGLLRTLNLYCPPAYTKKGDVKPSVEA